MLERPIPGGVRPETTAKSLERKTDSETGGGRTVSEALLAENTVLDQLQSGSIKQLLNHSAHESNESKKDNQDLAALLREDTLSGQLNGLANGLGEVALETVQGVAELGVSGVKTGYDLLLGSAVYTVGEVLGQNHQLPEWAPDSERGVERLKTGAGVVAELATNPGLMIDAIVEPIEESWAQGRYGEAIGRGIAELVSVTAGAQGASKLVKGAKIGPDESSSIMDWSPDKAPPWSNATFDTLLAEINTIRVINPIGAEYNSWIQ